MERSAPAVLFERAGLPVAAREVGPYRTKRLNQAYDRFLASFSGHAEVTVDEDGWRLSTDPTDSQRDEEEEAVAALSKGSRPTI